MIRAAVLACLLLAIVPSVVFAHAELDEATPGPGDVVRTVPRELVATFTQNLDPRRSSISLRSASNAVLADGRVTGAREIRLTLPRLSPGTYTVRWTTYSTEDNEIARGTYTFRVAAPAPSPSPSATSSVVPATPTASASPRGTGSGDESGADVLLPVVVALVAIAGIAAWVLRRR